MTIRSKAVFACLCFGLLPMLVAGTTTWWMANRIARSSADQFLFVAETLADEVDRSLAERCRDVLAFSRDASVVRREWWYKASDDNPLVASMNRYVESYGVYYLTLLVDTDGKVVAVNSIDASGRPIETGPAYGTNFRDAPWFQRALAGQFDKTRSGKLTQAVLEDLHVDPLVQQVFGGDGLAIGFSTPVHDEEGQPIAVWRNVVKFNPVEEIFFARYRTLADHGLRSSELTLLDKEGNVIVDCDPSLHGTSEIVRDMNIVGRFNLAKNQVEAAERLVRGEAGVIPYSLHARKRIYQCAGFTPLRGEGPFPTLPWNVLVRVPADEAFAPTAMLKNAWMITGILALIAIPLATLWLVRNLMRPIQQTTDIMRSLAVDDADLTRRLDEDRSDELGELGKWSNRFTQRIRHIIAQVAGNASTLTDASAELASMANNLAAGANESMHQSTTVSSAAEEMSISMKNMAESTERMSGGMREVSTSLEQMTATVEEIAANAEKSASVAGEAASMAEVSNEKISELGTAADEIGKVIEVIQDIAEQTNLLALNATIEAARAGDAGKGFAVVATEVKELAKQTATATDDIRARIEAIQTSTGTTVQSIGEISQAIGNVNEVARTIASAVEEQSITTKEIANTVSHAATAADTVARGVSECAEAGEEISRSIASIDQAARQTTRGAAKARLAGDELRSLASTIGEMVSKFKVGDPEAASGGHADITSQLHAEVPEEILASWRRVADTEFLDTFYRNFLDADPRVAEHFANTDLKKQKTLLRKSLVYVLNAPSGDAASLRKLKVLAETHSEAGMNIEPDLYPRWEESLIDALGRHDPEWNSQLASRWRAQLQPAIEMMTSGYRVAELAMA